MRLLAIDPGKTSGLAILEQHSDGCSPYTLSAVPFNHLPHALDSHLDAWHIPAFPLSYIILEGWENQGKNINVNCRWPLEVIGMVRLAAYQHEIPLLETYSSQWKPQYQTNWELTKVPEEVKARKAELGLAHHIYHDLGHWPDDLAAIKEPDKGHVINALALGLWAVPEIDRRKKLEEVSR